MRTWQRRGFTAASALIIVTGVVYFWMKYCLVSDDPFAVVNHPLQPFMLHAHVLTGPAFLIMFGIVFDAHVAWAFGAAIPLRRSGLTSLVTVLAMAASGYLLQVVTGEQTRRICAVVHIVSGAVFAGAYVTHMSAAWRRRRKLLQAPQEQQS